MVPASSYDTILSIFHWALSSAKEALLTVKIQIDTKVCSFFCTLSSEWLPLFNVWQILCLWCYRWLSVCVLAAEEMACAIESMAVRQALVPGRSADQTSCMPYFKDTLQFSRSVHWILLPQKAFVMPQSAFWCKFFPASSPVCMWVCLITAKGTGFTLGVETS